MSWDTMRRWQTELERARTRWLRPLALASALVALGALGACASEDDAEASATAPAALAKAASASAGDLQVELHTAGPLAVGYQDIALKVTRGGVAVTKAAIALQPRMAMMDKAHGCPVVQPPAEAAADGLFHAALMPQMASSDKETWALEATITPDGGAAQTVTFADLAVAAAPWAKTLKVAGAMERYVVTLRFAAPPKVGANAVRLSVHSMAADMMAFPAVADATVKVTPEHVSMGHGSSGNVDPVAVGGGFYEGEVNISMPGDWRFTFAIAVGGADKGAVAFDVDVP
jgi:hypothetical protein